MEFMRTGRLLIHLIFLIESAVFLGCSTSGKLARQNIAGFYKPDQKLNGLSFAVFNLDDSLSSLYFRFPLDKLKYQQITGASPVARYQLEYQVYDGYEKGVLIDSGSYHGIDSLLFAGNIEDSLKIRALTGRNYIIYAVLKDLNAQNSYGQYINLSKFLHNAPADFLLTDISNKPLMRTYLLRNEKVRIRARFSQDSVIRLNHYSFGERETANAPFTYPADNLVKMQEPAAISEIRFLNNTSVPFLFEEEGVYTDHLTNGRRLVFCRFYDGFPEIGSVVKMREAVRYISTDEEYKKLFTLPPRAAVDRFWIDLTGNPERALSQIKRYYRRVEEANKLFSNSVEGWRSDRGMIYIVFGSPGIVYRNSALEEWTYGEPGNPLSVKFYFHISVNNAGIEDYKVVRSEDYRRPWHLAVSNWRR
ncbi:MAG: GWxTD domain-containing protein [Bacteroidota bacterium]